MRSRSHASVGNPSLSATIPCRTVACDEAVLARAVARTRLALPSERPVTVVIPTAGRWHALAQLVAAVGAQLRPSDELVVVVNAQATSPCASLIGATRVLHEPRLGASWARNTGWRAARHPRIVFLDDDTRPDAACIDVMRAQLDRSEVVTGGVIGANTDRAVALLFDREFALHRGWLPRRHGGTSGSQPSARETWRVGVGAVMAWRRSALETIGGFDPALGNGAPGGGAEDLDAFDRALSAGFEVRYEPRSTVWHRHPQTLDELTQTMRSYQRALGGWGTKRALEGNGLVGVAELAAQVRDTYKGSARSLMGRSALPARPQFAAAPDALRGAVRFVTSRRACRTGMPVRAVAVRSDSDSAAQAELEVDVTMSLPELAATRGDGEHDRVLLRNGAHPVALVDLPADASALDAVSTWAHWVDVHPEGEW